MKKKSSNTEAIQKTHLESKSLLEDLKRTLVQTNDLIGTVHTEVVSSRQLAERLHSSIPANTKQALTPSAASRGESDGEPISLTSSLMAEITLLQRENAEVTKKLNDVIAQLEAARAAASKQTEELARLVSAFLEQSDPVVQSEILNPDIHALSAEAEIELIKGDPRFNEDWYLKMYPDVEASGVDAAWHYVVHGSAENRDPGPNFSTRSYILSQPSLKDAGISALADAIIKGK